MKNLLLLTCICLMAFTNNAFAQYDVLDFEPAGAGAGFNWIIDQNGANPPMTFIANPDGAGNASATVAEFNATTAGMPWALTFTDDIDPFMFDATNTTVKIWVWKPSVSNIGMKFEGTSPAIELLVSNTLTNQWEEITFDFSGQIGNTYNRLVIIPDFDFGGRPADRILYMDNIQIPDGNIVPTPTPMVAAPTPLRDETAYSVISVYSDAYTDVAGTDFNPFWGQTTIVTPEVIAGDNALKYSNLNYQGTALAAPIDVSGANFVHVDYWSANSTAINFYLISPGPAEIGYALPTGGGWMSADIPLSYFGGTVDLANVFQFKVDGNGDVYFDNMYFYTDVAIPTMGEWGLIFLALVFLSLNMAFFFAPKTQVAGASKGFNVSFKQFPFNGKSYQKAMIFALALGAVMLGTTFMIWGTITMVDMIGGMICLPVFAYLTHFFIKENA